MKYCCYFRLFFYLCAKIQTNKNQKNQQVDNFEKIFNGKYLRVVMKNN